MPKIIKEIISAKQEKIKSIQKQKKQLENEIDKLKEKKCFFCQKLLPVSKRNYLKNRYRLKFWNNQEEDDRLICYACLRYGWTRGLPFFDRTPSQTEKGGAWSKLRTFRAYQKKGYFKEAKKNNGKK